MISLVERGEGSPTAVVLERLATGLGVTLASLFDAPPASGPVARRDHQPEWRDPASGYLRRNVSPAGRPAADADRRGRFPARARASRSKPARATCAIHQQIWVLEGMRIDITVGDERHRLRDGDCLAMQLDRPTMFHNPTRKTARYAVVIASESSSRR